MRRQKITEFLLPICLILFAVCCIFFSNTGSNALGMKGEFLTPNFYSNILSVCLIVAASVQIGAQWMLLKNGVAKEKQKEKWAVTAFVMICSVLYVIGISHIGFYVSTLVCLFLLNMTFEGWKRECIWKAAVFSAGVCLIFFVAFQQLKVFLPKSILF